MLLFRCNDTTQILRFLNYNYERIVICTRITSSKYHHEKARVSLWLPYILQFETSNIFPIQKKKKQGKNPRNFKVTVAANSDINYSDWIWNKEWPISINWEYKICEHIKHVLQTSVEWINPRLSYWKSFAMLVNILHIT